MPDLSAILQINAALQPSAAPDTSPPPTPPAGVPAPPSTSAGSASAPSTASADAEPGLPQGLPVAASSPGAGYQWSDPALAQKMAAVNQALAAGTGTQADAAQPATGGGAPASPPAAGAPAHGYTTAGGLVANIGAGTSEGVAQTLGAPVDLATAGLNLVPEAINAVTGSKLPTIQNPVGGSKSIEKAFGLIGANPENVRPENGVESALRAGARGATSVALPGSVARALPEAASIGLEGLRGMFAGGAGAGGTVAGATGAVVGQQAANAVPDQYKGLADLVGNIAGGGLAAAGEAAATGAGRAAASAASRIKAPLSIGSKETLVDPATGQPVTAGKDGPVITATPDQIRLAAHQVASKAGQSPADLAASIPSPEDATLVPGSTPSMGQLTGNTRLLGYERQLRQLPAGRAAFTDAEGVNNQARLDAMQGLAPADAGHQAAQFVQDRLKGLQARAEQIGAQGASSARAASDAAGIGDARQDIGAIGADQQAALEGMRAPVKQAAGRLLNAIDPDGRLALDASGIGAVAHDIAGGVGLGGSLNPAERGVLDAAQTLDGVAPFSAVRELASNVGEALRSIRRDPQLGAESKPYRRMSQLMDAVQGAISDAAAEQATKDTEAVAAGTKAPGDTIMARLTQSDAENGAAPDAGASVFTPSGRQIGVRYRVLDGDNLITSHDQDLRPNPAFPADLQPRDRGRAASQVQIQKIAGALQPERLGASASAGDGAPIIGPDGVVESGNARALAIQRAYADGGQSATDYRDWLTAQGFDLTGLKNPVLVRERTTDLNPEDRQRFTQEANASQGLKMGATERAAIDAGRIPKEAMDQLQPGDVDHAQNRPFVRAFAKGVLENGEEGDFFTGDGALSREGAQRIRNALTHRAYGDAGLVGSLAEAGDDSLRGFGAALTDASGDMAKLKSGIESGQVAPSVDLAPRLVEAAKLVRQARARKVSLADMLAQRDMLSGGPHSVTREILQAAYGKTFTGRISRAKLADLLSFYADEASKQSTAPRLFGDNATPSEILAQGIAREKSRPTGPAGSPRYADGIRQGPGADGDQARRPDHGAQGTGNGAPGTVGSAALARPLLQEELRPNFTPETAARLRQANAAYADYKLRFRQGTIGEVLQSATSPSGFKLAESMVPAKLFAPGAKGAKAATDLIVATGSPEAARKVLGDYPAFSLRAEAMKPDGTLDPRRVEAWRKKYQPVLQHFPELAQRFASVAQAQRAADDASARAQEAIAQFQNSAARHYLGAQGYGTDLQVAINRFMSDENPAKAVKQFITLAGGNQAAVDGLRRNIVDWLMAKTRGTLEAGTSGTKEISSQVFARTINTPKTRGALEAAFTPAQMKVIDGIGQDLERAARAYAAVAIKGSPATAADLHALGHDGGVSLLVLADIGSKLGESFAHVMSAGGVLGSAMGLAGTVGGAVLNAARAAGFGKVDAVATQMVLHPELGRLLLQRAAAAGPRTSILQKAVRRLIALAPGAAVQSSVNR